MEPGFNLFLKFCLLFILVSDIFLRQDFWISLVYMFKKLFNSGKIDQNSNFALFVAFQNPINQARKISEKVQENKNTKYMKIQQKTFITFQFRTFLLFS